MTDRLFNRYSLVSVNDNEQENDNVFDGDSWDNTNDDLKVVTECGRKPSGPMNIILSRITKTKIDILMKKYQNTEWLAYLIGDENTRYVNDIFVPTQVASTCIH